jgi:glyoxylase-like metal-dependent hydrolase (beta-lactamase superfamily II)
MPAREADSAAEFVASRRIGDATVTVISEGSMLWAPRYEIAEDDRRRALPDADADGRIVLGLNLVHLRVGDASILVDPGCDDPTSSWQERFAARFPGVTRSAGLTAGLAHIRVHPEDVTHVVITHTHGDHFGGVTVDRGGAPAPRFPHARHMVGRGDWDGNPARGEPESDVAMRLGLIDRLRMLSVVDAEREIAPGVGLIPAPGETPGHLVVRLRSRDDCFYYLGDLLHHPCEVEQVAWAPPGRNMETLRASRERLFAEGAQQRATCVFTHARFPPWGRIVRAGRGYRWENV